MSLRERVSASLADIRSHGQRLVRLNVELLTAEVKAKGQKYGAAVGMLVGAAVLALYALGFVFATVAVALDLVLPLWLALLIVTLVLIAIAAVLVQVARDRIRAAGAATPERAAAEARSTIVAARAGAQAVIGKVKTGRREPADAAHGMTAGWSPPPGRAATPSADAPPRPPDKETEAR